MEIPKLLITVGFGLILVGLVAWGAQRIPWIYSWFGQLPGDIRYEGERTFIYAPIVSMLLSSLVVSVAVWVVSWLVRR